MQTIQLKTVEMQADDQVIQLSYHAQLTEVLRTPADGKSADYNEIRRSIRLLDILEKNSGPTLTLEDADYEYMKERVLATRWPMINKALQQFIEDVTGGNHA